MNNPKILVVVNDNFFGGIQLRWDYLKDKFTNIEFEVISRQNLGNMGFKVIEDFVERVKLINTFDVVDFQTNGLMTIDELSYCQNKVVETIHSLECSNQKTDMKIGMSDCVSLMQKYPCKTIYPGINLERIAKGNREELRKKWGVPNNMPVVGRIGRMVDGKRPFDFAEVAKNVKGAYYLVVADNHNDNFTKYMQEGGCTWNFIKGNPEINKDFWSIIDILLYPTEDESFCNVLWEAIFSDVPLITYSIPITNEFDIQLRLEKNNIGMLISGLKTMIENKDLRDKAVQQGRAIRGGMDMKDSIPKLEKFYILLAESN